MVQLTYDVGDVEEFEGYAGPTPKRGIYDAEIISSDWRESKKGHMMYEIILRIKSTKKDQKEFNGCPLWQYYVIGDLSEDWMKRNMKAVAKVFLSGKDKGKFDPEATAKKMVGKKVRVIVKNELYKNPEIEDDEGTMQAKANGLLPFKDEAAAEDEPAADAEDAEPDAEGEEPEEDGEEDAEPEEDVDEESTTVEEDIADLTRAELKAYIVENAEYLPNLINDKGAAKVYKSQSDDDIRSKILEEWPSEEEGEDAEPEGDEPPF